MSASLFHTVAAATAKALVPMTVFVRCTTSFMVSADRKRRRLRTVEAKTHSSAKYCGARPWMHLKTVMATLKSIRCRTGSHEGRAECTQSDKILQDEANFLQGAPRPLTLGARPAEGSMVVISFDQTKAVVRSVCVSYILAFLSHRIYANLRTACPICYPSRRCYKTCPIIKETFKRSTVQRTIG